jgi:site-specific recombinase XerD
LRLSHIRLRGRCRGEPAAHRDRASSKTFLDELQETAAFATHKKYRLLLTKLIEFSAQRGYVMIDQSDPTDVREFRTSWAINPQTRALRMSMLKSFFEYCVANEWIGRKGPSAFRRGGSRLQSGS